MKSSIENRQMTQRQIIIRNGITKTTHLEYNM